jgi:tRNA modification GTPase
MNTQAICAIATPPGSSALGIIRISGKNLKNLTKQIFSKDLEDRKAILVSVIDHKNLLDNCVSIFYESPKSYTGEDMIEIICHGNQVIMNSILSLLNKKGIRIARPGEFTERAFFNDKVDLIQAEAISDLISSSDSRAVKAAHNSLSGKFADEIKIICEKILSTRAEVESVINFPEDDDVPVLSIASIKNSLAKILIDIEALIKKSKKGRALNNRPTYAVVGKPNSGKSSLINFLLREDASIVTSKKGTTRDSICYQLNLNNSIVNIIDTAGIHDTNDEIEKEGIARSASSIAKSDRVLYLVDDNQGLTQEDKKLIEKYDIKNYFLVFNKIDITKKESKITTTEPQEIYVSVKTGEGMHLIEDIIKTAFKSDNTAENIYLARSRHIECLQNGQKHLLDSKNAANEKSLDILAEELRLSHIAISSILGQNPTEDLLTEIFASFCIGK